MKKKILGFALLFLSTSVTRVYSDCSQYQPKEKILTVQSCRSIDPKREKKITEYAEAYPKGFVESYRDEALQHTRDVVESYRGAVIEGSTVDTGAGPYPYPGNELHYFYASRNPNICSQFPPGSRFKVKVGSSCCDGDPGPPCYLGFSAYVVPGSEKPEPSYQ